MKTRMRFLAAAALAAGLAAAVAQSNTYSSNIVGWVNVTVPAKGFVLVGNPLDTGSNVLDNILSTAPNNITKVYDFSPATGSYTLYTKRQGHLGGDNPPVDFSPGRGFFIQNFAVTNITITFTGEVWQGTNGVAYPAGFSILASPIPVAGPLTDLGQPGDRAFQFDPATGIYMLTTFRAAGWRPSAPWLGTNSLEGVAEAFFYQAVNAGTWKRAFAAE